VRVEKLKIRIVGWWWWWGKVSGGRFQRRRQPKKRPVKSKRNSEERITNIEQGIPNIEVRYSIINIFE
jgi:hypothetical protein